MAYDIKQSVLNRARYNERVNREMYAILSVLTGRARKQEAGSWFRSIHGILNHLIICDLNWLKRYRARPSNFCFCTKPITVGRSPRFWTVWDCPTTSRTTLPTLRVNDKMPQM